MSQVRVSETPFNTRYGRFRLLAFGFPSGREHAALVVGRTAVSSAPLVRVQSSCLTGTAFGALLCDCAQQLDLALRMIVDAQQGCVLYLQQEGRGHGLVEKVEHLKAISAGADTVDAALDRGVPPDVRAYAEAAEMLARIYGTQPVELLTNNPEKLHGLKMAGVEISKRVSLETEPTPHNRDYLIVKKLRMGHLLTRV